MQRELTSIYSLAAQVLPQSQETIAEVTKHFYKDLALWLKNPTTQSYRVPLLGRVDIKYKSIVNKITSNIKKLRGQTPTKETKEQLEDNIRKLLQMRHQGFLNYEPIIKRKRKANERKLQNSRSEDLNQTVNSTETKRS